MAARSSFGGAALFMMIVAALAPRFSGRSIPPPAAPAPPPAPAPRTSTPTRIANAALWGSACDLLSDYYGRDSGATVAADSGQRCADYPPVHATPIVAILPDPVRSHLDWLYDSGLESIQRAYERAGYTLDRYWLPWGTGNRTASGGGAGGSGRGSSSALRRPGVLIFRRGAVVGCDAIGVVFVVGETPTSGIHKPAFEEALRERDALTKASQLAAPTAQCDTSVRARWTVDAKQDSPVLRIMGPTFSGSSPSLRRALDQWLAAHGDGRVEIVSGTANALSNRAILTGSTRRITFSATLNRVELVLQALQQALDTLDICPSEIAYLRESTTQFGQATGTNMAAGSGGKAADGNCEAREWTRGDSLVPPPLQIPFPLNISSLRSENARVAQPATTGQPGAAAPPEASFDLGDSTIVRETPAVTSSLTAAMVELALNDIVATLTIHKVKVVVIIATDVRDRLFLASEVKRRLPDVETLLVGANSLYLRPELTSDLRGALVVTTYPLVLESQFWDLTQSRDRQRFPFTSDLAEGIFNAMLVQLKDSRDMADFGYPMSGSDTARLRARLTPCDTRQASIATPRCDTTRPPVWITMVGRASFLPVTAIPVNGEGREEGSPFALTDTIEPGYVHPRVVTESEYRVVTEDTRGIRSSGFLMVIMAVSLGSLFVLWISSREWASALEHQAEAAGARVSATPAEERASEHWRIVRSNLLLDRESWVFFRFTALFGLLAPLSLVMFHARIHGRAVDEGTTWVSRTLAVISLAAFVYSLGSAVARAWRASVIGSERNWPGLSRFGGLTLAGVVYFLLVSFFIGQVLDIGGARAGMFFVRALQFGSGVTPLLPLFLGGLVLTGASVWNVSRVRQLSELASFEAGWIQETLAKETAPKLTGWRAKLGAWRTRVSAALDAKWLPATTRDACVSPGDALAAAVAKVRQRLSDVIPGAMEPSALVILLIAGIVFGWQKQPSPERLALPCRAYPSLAAWTCEKLPAFDLLLTGLIIAALILLIWDLVRFWSVWRELRRCLELVGTTPIFRALASLPASVAQLASLSTFVPPSESLVASTLDAAADDRWAELGKLHDAPHPLAGVMPNGGRPPLRTFDCQFDVPSGAHYLAIYKEAMKPGGSGHPKAPRNAPQVYRELAALYFIEYVERVMRQLQTLAEFILATIFVTILLLSSYPFAPESLIKSAFLIVMALTTGALLSVLFQRNRNATLRAIAQADAEEGTWNVRLILNLALVLGVPLLALLSSTFPEVRSLLFSWIAPLLQALSKS